jgi:hypothetical protein
LLIITPLVDFVANVAPLRPFDLHWRYGTVALLSGFQLTPLLGMLISTWAAVQLEQPNVQWILGLVNLAAGILLALVLVLFGFDLLELRHGVPADGRLTFDVGSLKALGKHLLALPLLFWLGVANLKLARSHRRDEAGGSGRGHVASRLRARESGHD